MSTRLASRAHQKKELHARTSPARLSSATALAALTVMAVALSSLACGAGSDGSGAPAGSNQAPSAAVEAGQKHYQRTCAMCHGFSGEGVQRLGKPLVGSRFVRDQSDDELVRFLAEGRSADHEDNTQGIAMPPRGGNPSLTDEDLAAIVAYLRSIS